MKRRYTEDQFKQAVTNSTSMAGVLRTLGLKATGANYTLAHKRIQNLGLSITHWTGQGHLRGKSHDWTPRQPLSEILIENSSYSNMKALKQRLIKAGLLTFVCAKCGLAPEWQGQFLSLHLDHINGNHYDNRIENLQFLCPNCHSQTNTYAGKNRPKRSPRFCLDCGISISHQATRCLSCAIQHQKK